MSNLGICLVFKDSARYLKEWLLFHYVQGVRKFYLYDNESEDDWRVIVKPWVDSGFVEAVSYRGYCIQQDAYSDCVLKARGVVEWLAFVDDDEFLYPANGGRLLEMLNDYSNYAGVAVSWMLFGSGGSKHYSNNWVIERFTSCLENPDSHVKCIVRPDRVEKSICVGHMFETIPGYDIVDERFRILNGSQNSCPSASKFRINHYLVKSWEEWAWRRCLSLKGKRYVTPIPRTEWEKSDIAWSRAKDWTAIRYLKDMRDLEDVMYSDV